MIFYVLHGNLWDGDSLPSPRGRDALRNYAGGIVLAKAGSGSDRDKVARESRMRWPHTEFAVLEQSSRHRFFNEITATSRRGHLISHLRCQLPLQGKPMAANAIPQLSVMIHFLSPGKPAPEQSCAPLPDTQLAFPPRSCRSLCFPLIFVTAPPQKFSRIKIRY